MDLIFVAHHLLGELLLQAHQFPIGDDFFARDIAKTCFCAKPHTCNGATIQAIRFRAQSSLLGEGVDLTGMLTGQTW
jgi:hypothetical protein